VPSDEVRDTPSCEVTLGTSKGALGTWRVLSGPGRRAGINRVIKDAKDLGEPTDGKEKVSVCGGNPLVMLECQAPPVAA
jgi:hypothetical protein